MSTAERRSSAVFLFIAVCLIAANMRPTITSIGPLLDQIGADTGMGASTLGLVASVPLVAWAIFSPVAHDLTRRFGMSRVMLWALLLLTVGTVVRSLPGPVVSLWIGTALLGIALAIVNVLMPAVVKRDFSGHVAGMTALYSALLGGFGAIASGIAVPVSHLSWPQDPAGWRFALLLIGGILLPFAIVAWIVTSRRSPTVVPARAPGRRRRTGIWTDRTAWLVAGYMGAQASIFYMLVTWLASISTSIGRSPVVAGLDVMLYQLFSIAGSLILPLLLRGRARRVIPALIPSVGVIGVIGLMLAPEGIMFWAACLGSSSGASLSMSLTLMAQRARDHDTAAALSGMSQSVGYVVAALGPVLFGWAHATTGNWMISLGLLLLALACQSVIGMLVGRDRYVLER
ncbi:MULTISPECIES: MFS transporter [unclassified Microbacterium]|uniref:MFS transporter n=1 Tax=unclassified Microbacterium TaxID=2609290 RepID=UPI00214C181B|nr:MULTISPECIES: MFS transporter [unclassified Microbacterium]MCR2808496.1 MFS transporter [Microbacterium sp. zg.B185]WIM19064.1 MFS transporter [Microbacterium sp. zg-B185]